MKPPRGFIPNKWYVRSSFSQISRQGHLNASGFGDPRLVPGRFSTRMVRNSNTWSTSPVTPSLHISHAIRSHPKLPHPSSKSLNRFRRETTDQNVSKNKYFQEIYLGHSKLTKTIKSSSTPRSFPTDFPGKNHRFSHPPGLFLIMI